ncbi:MAG: GNAT family N-acetyltransferase [Deltaproteobacteria bacterium]|nr:GNAT family N-acetyltransferase [Deltaproteobacteria bacterium]
MTFRVERLEETALSQARVLLDRASAWDPSGDVAEEKLFGGYPQEVPGGALGAWEGNELVGVIAFAGRWIRVLAVKAEQRGLGVGSALLEQALENARNRGDKVLRTGDQPGNYLSPGIDARDTAFMNWFERRGFRRVARNENLEVQLVGNPLVTIESARAATKQARERGYEIRRILDDERVMLTRWISEHFSPAWAFEVRRAAQRTPAAVHVARWHGEFVAFAAHDGNNSGRGSFGPAGTLDSQRGAGLGRALLLRCLVDVARAGLVECSIAWIGPRAFYERTVGVTTGRTLVVLERAL